jgi:hypothetical protein
MLGRTRLGRRSNRLEGDPAGSRSTNTRAESASLAFEWKRYGLIEFFETPGPLVAF